MKPLLSVIVAGALLGGTVLADHAEAGDKRRGHGREVRYERYDSRYYRDSRDSRHDQHYYRDRYYRERDVVVIRDYYRPYYRPLPPGLHRHYYRTGYLPPGWAKRIRPVPVHVERELVVVPHGYHRGL
ncbi:MAG: hypothetical protein ABW318_07930, partial [Vicinamibacterales bacterium]